MCSKRWRFQKSAWNHLYSNSKIGIVIGIFYGIYVITDGQNYLRIRSSVTWSLILKHVLYKIRLKFD